MRYGERGPHVEAVGRALARAPGSGMRLSWFVLQPKLVRRTWGKRKQKALIRFKRRHGLPANPKYGRPTHAKLSPFFDARARALLAEATKPRDPKLVAYDKLLAVMKQMSALTPGYGYGSGHGERLDTISYRQRLDCSSSTSKALHDAGFFPYPYAWVSGDFARRYGVPGRGKFFTVYANDGHVWIKLEKRRLPWWRFDTSPHGDGSGSGPRLRITPRRTSGFSARHHQGM